MSDEYDILVEISLDDVKKAAEERDNRDAEITRLREELTSAKRAAKAYEAWKFPEDIQALTVEIERLREENARLREALKPFGQLFLYPDDLGFEASEDIRADVDWDEDANEMQTENVFVLRRDIRAARAAIREGGKE